MKKLFWIFCALILSSCTFSISAEDLLSPPKMSAEQEQIHQALELAVGTASFKFKYPIRGEYLSAVILHDIDFDGIDEAFAFYELENNNSVSTWISFLVYKDGNWRSVREIPAVSSDIDMVSFERITDSNREDIIVGWSLAGEDYSSCCIYSFDGNDAERLHEIELPYSEMLIENVDDNELREIVLTTKTNTRSQMRLVKFRAGKIVTVGLITMPERIKEYKKLSFGSFTENMKCIFADVLLSSGELETKLVLVENSTISDINPEDIGVYESFRRLNSPFLCQDVNYDGLVDIPVTVPMPQYEDVPAKEAIYRTKYVSVQNGELVTVMNLVANEEDGYSFMIPESWADTVTIKKQSDTGEWRFYIYNGEEAVAEILRINSVNSNEYQDKLQTHDYKLLSEVGAKKYVCYIPSENYPGYTLTFQEVAERFKIMQDIIED